LVDREEENPRGACGGGPARTVQREKKKKGTEIATKREDPQRLRIKKAGENRGLKETLHSIRRKKILRAAKKSAKEKKALTAKREGKKKRREGRAKEGKLDVAKGMDGQCPLSKKLPIREETQREAVATNMGKEKRGSE